MRLLDTRTFTLESYFDDVPPYAILSHCWEEEEVIFSDLQDLDAARRKKGFVKIENTCAQAIKDGFDYCWIDTCCIQKDSSAELSEAINSMFAWYKSSSKCYAYLADVKDSDDFAESKWFTRAWTLQELLAPSHIQTDAETGMEFFSRDWVSLGSKGGLSTTISKITGIPKEYLERTSLDKASISMRMSWAAERQATRSEDIAYSLLGIFDVNMPLLYGEGKYKAFRRLQEEIMKISEDETLFAWESTEIKLDGSSTDVLASGPMDFSEAADLVPFGSDEPVPPYNMTHRGLRIWISLYDLREASKYSVDPRHSIRPLRSPVMIFVHDELVWAALRCHVAHDYHHYVMIPLRHLAADMYCRDTSTSVALVPTTIALPSGGNLREIYIRNNRTSSISNSTHRRHGIFIRNIPHGYKIRGVMPKQAWDAKSNILQSTGRSMGSGQPSWRASLRLTMDCYDSTHSTTGYMYLSLGCNYDHTTSERKPWCYLDDSVYVYERIDRSMQQFHDSVFNKRFKENARMSLMTKTGEMIYFHLEVKISTENIFGQPMFVVDFVHKEIGEQAGKAEQNLGIPNVTTQEKISGSGPRLSQA